jgi:lysophospholipase L1-like esterase
VLNDRHDVSPETRKRIVQVMTETGYQPSLLARNLSQRRFKDNANTGTVDQADQETLKINPRNTLLMIGDSITACQRDISNPADLGKGYVSFVDGLLTACYPSRHIRVLNRGVPGDTVRELKARSQTDVLDLQPDWLSVCIGINDVWQQFDGKHEGQSHVTLNEYEQTLDELLTNVRPMLKGLILMTPYFIQPRGEPMRTMMDEYGKAAQRLAQKHEAIFVDTQAVFDRAVEFTPVETLAWDRAHLNIPGHMILARAVLQSVDFTWSIE